MQNHEVEPDRAYREELRRKTHDGRRLNTASNPVGAKNTIGTNPVPVHIPIPNPLASKSLSISASQTRISTTPSRKPLNPAPRIPSLTSPDDLAPVNPLPDHNQIQSRSAISTKRPAWLDPTSPPTTPPTPPYQSPPPTPLHASHGPLPTTHLPPADHGTHKSLTRSFQRHGDEGFSGAHAIECIWAGRRQTEPGRWGPGWSGTRAGLEKRGRVPEARGT